MPPLKIAIGNYGLTRALKDGTTPCGRLDLQHIEVDPIIMAMRRMCRAQEFDISEMAFTTYLCARAVGLPFTAIPVFLTRNFHHWAMFYNAKSGITQPKDLEGRRVAVNRGYTVTTGLWARGILQNEYGVDLDKVTWLPTDDEHVAEFKQPANVDYRLQGQDTAELLRSGAVDAAVGDIKLDSADVQPFFPDARAVSAGYFRRTGIYPINHSVVIHNSVLEANPWVAEELFAALKVSKQAYFARLDSARDLTPADQQALSLGEIVGDPFPYGLEANRPALQALVQMAADQHIIPEPWPLESLFAAGTPTLT